MRMKICSLQELNSVVKICDLFASQRTNVIIDIYIHVIILQSDKCTSRRNLSLIIEPFKHNEFWLLRMTPSVLTIVCIELYSQLTMQDTCVTFSIIRRYFPLSTTPWSFFTITFSKQNRFNPNLV